MTHNSGIGSVQSSHVGGGFSEVGGGGRAEGGLKKGPWTAAEDTILMEYVRKHGEGDWNAVRRNSGLNRCGKSCRLRWANHLRPNLKRGAFSPEEERLILELHAKYGNKWARMAAQLPGRTDNEIKNYWNTRVKRRQRQGLPLYPIDIQQYSSQPTMPTVHSAPTTPTSLTSPTTQIFHFHNHSTHHSPIHSLSSTPTHLSPLNSPHQARPCFNFLSPTGPSANATATDHASSLAANSFTFHRPTPILQNPVRFFRNNQSNSGFQFSISPPQLSPAPLSPNQQCSSPVLVQQYQHQHQHQNQPQLLPSQLNDISSSSFQFPVSQTMVSSMQMLPQFKTEDVVLCGSVNSGATPELSSNQLSQNNTTSFYMTQYAKLGSPDTHNTGRGLLEDLLEEAQVLACENTSSRESCLISQDERGLMNSYHKLENSNSPHFFLGEKQMEEVSVCVNSADDDWSKLLNTVPSTEQVPNWYNDRGEISNGQSSGITDDMGLDMQHIASLFPTSNSKGDPAGTTSSCSWDNLPGICQGSGGF